MPGDGGGPREGQKSVTEGDSHHVGPAWQSNGPRWAARQWRGLRPRHFRRSNRAHPSASSSVADHASRHCPLLRRLRGRLTAHLPSAPRLILVKADGSVSIHADDRAYKPLNWMSPPCTLKEGSGDEEGVWTVINKAGEKLIITMEEVLHDSSHELGVDPGLIKDGVEAHLQELLADRIETLGEGYTLIRREYMTAIGPVDILCRDADGATVAVEIKRRGEIDGVEQLTRYLELLNRDPHLAPVRGIFAAQEIKPQARVLATDRGIGCTVLDYNAMRGIEDDKLRLF